MREAWKLPIIVRSSASGPPEGYTEVWVDPDKILGMTRHPNTGWATLLMPQGMIDTVVAFDKLWAALPADKVTFQQDAAVAPDPRDTRPKTAPEHSQKLDSLHHSHHHT